MANPSLRSYLIDDPVDDSPTNDSTVDANDTVNATDNISINPADDTVNPIDPIDS
jgi:hypothetical protein